MPRDLRAPSEAARNSNNAAIAGPDFRANFLFVPGFRRYSDANPEQIMDPGDTSGTRDNAGNGLMEKGRRRQLRLASIVPGEAAVCGCWYGVVG
jgi:hypothetical protein